MQSIVKRINMIYYSLYFLTIAITVIGYFLTMESDTKTIDPQSSTGIILSSVVIIYLLISIPGALALFHRYTKKLIPIQDEFLKLNKYAYGATLRLLFIGLGLIFSVITFYLLRNQSMLFSAFIAFVSLIFCKPTERKIMRELQMDENEDE